MWTADLPLADEGSEKHKGVYPPASCGFYALYDGKADFFTQQKNGFQCTETVFYFMVLFQLLYRF